MELVTHPDLKDGEDAASFVRELQMLLQTIGTCDGKMQGGYSLSVGGYRFLLLLLLLGVVAAAVVVVVSVCVNVCVRVCVCVSHFITVQSHTKKLHYVS